MIEVGDMVRLALDGNTPNGRVERVYQNSDGDTFAVVRWITGNEFLRPVLGHWNVNVLVKL